MKPDWKTHAIGRHLVDVPASAQLVETWKYHKDPIELLTPGDNTQFGQLVSQREAQLKAQVQRSGKTSFVERALLLNGSVALVSWYRPYNESDYALETYFRAGKEILRSPGAVTVGKKEKALEFLKRCSDKWREIPDGQIPEGIGFVVGNTILADNIPTYESWHLLIQLAGKPDVTFQVSGFVGAADEGLRKRAGGILASMLGMAAGLSQLRNHARPVGPIQADEILVAGNQNGKRGYGFKWEAPGKDYSLAEPNLNVSLQVRESAYATNRESFSSDDEALELWDTVVNSIRLRAGAV
ncbi:T6SS immunity protein Tli4 family protein [Paraburkholderia sacchari]|uniref:T6SS immunity protein Tli4 family protein n=1 Tax=Paraburkholderia sacchari TaxID=159450 RepID=UPI001BCAC37B|nr:T6SS immunity protein Tli4 family protein [Paraburkholderia sacchari]